MGKGLGTVLILPLNCMYRFVRTSIFKPETADT